MADPTPTHMGGGTLDQKNCPHSMEMLGLLPGLEKF